MANFFADAVRFTAASAGTGDFVVNTAVQGFRTPAAASVPNAAAVSLRAESSDLSEWEESQSVYTSSGTSFTRVVTANHLGTTAKVNFTAPPQVAIVLASSDIVDAGKFTSGTVPTARLDPWGSQPIGVPIPLLDNLTGSAAPPTDKSYRYIKLTASDAYNTGILTSESVTGSAPLVIATAVIDLAGSPIDGETVNLINTEERFLRGSTSPGTAQNDQMQSHKHNGSGAGFYFFGGSSSSTGPTGGAGFRTSFADVTVTAPVIDGTNGTPRIGNETRSKNLGVTYYMRIL